MSLIEGRSPRAKALGSDGPMDPEDEASGI